MFNAALLACALAIAASPAHAAEETQPIQLITENEARIPPPAQPPVVGRNLTRGPTIEMASPLANFPSQAPFRFTLRFKAANSVPVDPKTLRVNYVRAQNIDITPRIASFVSASGVDITMATAPPGDHYLLISIEDQARRRAEASVLIKVAAP